MNDEKPREYAERLAAMLEALRRQDGLGEDAQKTVELDQQSVGRLSRMDALQQQAMARALAGRRSVEAARIKAALVRIDEGEFGYCLDCGEDIAEGRLNLDPATPLCLSCAQG